MVDGTEKELSLGDVFCSCFLFEYVMFFPTFLNNNLMISKFIGKFQWPEKLIQLYARHGDCVTNTNYIKNFIGELFT